MKTWKEGHLYRYKEENPNKTEQNILYIPNKIPWHVEDLSYPLYLQHVQSYLLFTSTQVIQSKKLAPKTQ